MKTASKTNETERPFSIHAPCMTKVRRYTSFLSAERAARRQAKNGLVVILGPKGTLAVCMTDACGCIWTDIGHAPIPLI
jgi:hypothetical protein